MNPLSFFPSNPTHGMLFELQKGLLYQYDAGINSWIKIASASVLLPLATDFSDGAMAAIDLKKLNRLLLPPPTSTIIGNDCVAPFRQGYINLYSGDKFVEINGTVNLKNVGPIGEKVNERVPFQIHEHTYGFDFNLNLQELIPELIRRNQFNLKGKPGVTGAKGDSGEAGVDFVLSGPQGDQGTQGTAPPCDLTLEPEIFNAAANVGLKRALTKASVVVDAVDKRKYKIVFDRQAVGSENIPVSLFNVKSTISSWVLAVSSVSGTAQSIYYIDLEPILETIHDKFIEEVNRLKKGYEDIVRFWIQTMSDLFDEQKRALCCALEFCLSATKTTQLRQHVESVAASAAGSASISIHNRDSSEVVEISSTKLLDQIDSPDHSRGGGADLCSSGINSTPFAQSLNVNPVDIIIDPLIHSAISVAYQIDLPSGNYVAIIKHTDAQIDNKYHAKIKIASIVNNIVKTQQLLNKGDFNSTTEAKQAYVGLSLPFDHDGGNIKIWSPSTNSKMISGTIIITIQPRVDNSSLHPAFTKFTTKTDKKLISSSCFMSSNHLRWYQKGWETNNCCGIVTNIMGQDFIVFKRSLGNDLSCGGGENISTPCIEKFLSSGITPAFAWPTLNGIDFAPIPDVDNIEFKSDNDLNSMVIDKLEIGDFVSPKGNIDNLPFQITTILFPIINES